MFALMPRTTCTRRVAASPDVVLRHLATTGRPLVGLRRNGGVGLRRRRVTSGYVYSNDRASLVADSNAFKPWAVVDVRVRAHDVGSELVVTQRTTWLAPVSRMAVAAVFMGIVFGALVSGQWLVAGLTIVAVVLASRTSPADKVWYERRRSNAENWLRPVLFALPGDPTDRTASTDPYLDEIVARSEE